MRQRGKNRAKNPEVNEDGDESKVIHCLILI